MIKNVETLLDYFSQIRKVYAGRLKIKHGEHTLSPNEIDILILLSNNKTIDTCGGLNMLLKVSKGLVSRSLANLAAQGLISMWTDEGDRRIRHIELTEEVEPVLEQINRGIREINDFILEDVTEEEIAQMERTMEKIMRNFKAAEERYI